MKITESREFRHKDQFDIYPILRVNISDTPEGFGWQLEVINKFNEVESSPWHRSYQTILSFKNWMVASAFWNGIFPEMVPFDITPSIETSESINRNSFEEKKISSDPFYQPDPDAQYHRELDRGMHSKFSNDR